MKITGKMKYRMQETTLEKQIIKKTKFNNLNNKIYPMATRIKK